MARKTVIAILLILGISVASHKDPRGHLYLCRKRTLPDSRRVEDDGSIRHQEHRMRRLASWSLHRYRRVVRLHRQTRQFQMACPKAEESEPPPKTQKSSSTIVVHGVAILVFIRKDLARHPQAFESGHAEIPPFSRKMEDFLEAAAHRFCSTFQDNKNEANRTSERVPNKAGEMAPESLTTGGGAGYLEAAEQMTSRYERDR